MRWQRTSKDEPLSMVLLLHEPHLFAAGELRLAAGRAWHVSFDGEEKDSNHFVWQSGTAIFMKAGPHVLNFFCYPGPYIKNPKENVDWLKQPSQQQAWIQHSACVGVAYLNPNVNVELGYCVLSQLVAEMLDGNCTAIYITIFPAAFLTAIEMLSLCTSMPIYFLRSIEGAPFCSGFEPTLKTYSKRCALLHCVG